MKNGKAGELLEEFRTVVMGRGNLIDTILPPVLFVIVNAIVGFNYAMWSSLIAAFFIAILRLRRHQSVIYAFGGLGAVLIAIVISQLLERAEGFFIPSILSGGFTILLCILSVILKRPLVAWTSFIARRWPLEWYWHPRVRPAYNEVTLFWTFFFGLRLMLQISLFQNRSADLLAFIQLLLGWPATIVLLVISYLYGTWRLQQLEGPSVDEFRDGADPPWVGQVRGF